MWRETSPTYRLQNTLPCTAGRDTCTLYEDTLPMVIQGRHTKTLGAGQNSFYEQSRGFHRGSRELAELRRQTLRVRTLCTVEYVVQRESSYAQCSLDSNNFRADDGRTLRGLKYCCSIVDNRSTFVSSYAFSELHQETRPLFFCSLLVPDACVRLRAVCICVVHQKLESRI